MGGTAHSTGVQVWWEARGEAVALCSLGTHLGWVDTNGGHGPPGVPVASLDLAEVMGGGGYTFILPVLEAGTCWLDTMPQVI